MAYPKDEATQAWLDAFGGLPIRLKKMFGCYCVYCDGQPVGWLSEEVFSLREVGLTGIPAGVKRPLPTDRIQEMVITLDDIAGEWLPGAMQKTARLLRAGKGKYKKKP